MKYCFIDTETTGTDETRNHEIHQIAAIVTDSNFEEIDSFEFSFCPSPQALFSQDALEKGLLKKEEVLSRKNTVYQAADLWTDFLLGHVNIRMPATKMQFVAYNSEFDERFMRVWMDRWCDSKFAYHKFFLHPSLCVMKEIAWVTREERNHVGRYTLENICKMVEIDFDAAAAHDALYDVRKTVELAKALK